MIVKVEEFNKSNDGSELKFYTKTERGYGMDHKE